MDELQFPLGAFPNLPRLLDLFLRNRNVGGADGRLPKLVIVRHGDSPMRHRTLRILFGHTLKCFFGVGIREGVKQSDAAVELLLNGRFAGDGKRHFSELLRCGVVVCFLPRQDGNY